MKKIGISACFFHSDPKRPVFKGKTLMYLEQSLAHWVMREGALVYMIPAPEAGAKVTLSNLADELDGLVLQGGSDVSPKSYGEEALRPEWNGDFIRDQYEIELVRLFMKKDKPILGICRGAQLLNVALGGTLYQDIEHQIPGSLNHRNWEIYDQNFHEIEIEKGSWLSRIHGGTTRARVNTIHHQGLKKLGQGLLVEAKSPSDGVIEAIRVPDAKFVCAVQWHPEFQDPNDRQLLDSRPLLQEFLSLC